MRGVDLLHVSDGRHYIGWSADINARLATHVRGQGSQLTRWAVAHGVELHLAAVWPGADIEVERHEALGTSKGPLSLVYAFASCASGMGAAHSLSHAASPAAILDCHSSLGHAGGVVLAFAKTDY